MHDDADFLRFGIDPQRRAALQTFVTEACRRIDDHHLREDAGMEAWTAMLQRCVQDPPPTDICLKGVAKQAISNFLRRENTYNYLFPISLEALPNI